MCNFFRKRKKQLKIDTVVMNKLIQLNNEECAFCLDPLKNEICMITKGCNHFFHAGCYEDYIESCEKQNKDEILCPFCRTVQ